MAAQRADSGLCVCGGLAVGLIIDQHVVVKFRSQFDGDFPSNAARRPRHQRVPLFLHNLYLLNNSACLYHLSPIPLPWVSIKPLSFLYLTRANPSINPFSSPLLRNPIRATEIS